MRELQDPRVAHLASAGVMASVSGTLTGNKAFVQMNASATDEPPFASMPLMPLCLAGSPLSLTSWAAHDLASVKLALSARAQKLQDSTSNQPMSLKDLLELEVAAGRIVAACTLPPLSLLHTRLRCSYGHQSLPENVAA